MLVLTATRRSNGDLAGDYDFCVDGELVYMQEPCGRDLRDPEGGGCGCGRGFAGANSHRATTTAVVTQSVLSEPEVREALRSSLKAGGWADPRVFSAEDVDRLLDEILADVGAVTSRFPVGTVVRRHLWRFYAA